MLLPYAAVYIGLAIDVERQKLYYADASTAGGNVGELSTDGTDHRELHSDPYSKPQSVVFDANNRFAFQSSDVLRLGRSVSELIKT